ncbi:MAG TPA: hypothetical protein QF572_09060 [Vicinamibacterales bacterium]|jgi:hypothetical protein|nr:hypothetical protein [Vicinamibacterales bacterium]
MRFRPHPGAVLAILAALFTRVWNLVGPEPAFPSVLTLVLLGVGALLLLRTQPK